MALTASQPTSKPVNILEPQAPRKPFASSCKRRKQVCQSKKHNHASHNGQSTSIASELDTGTKLFRWLQVEGMPEQRVSIRPYESLGQSLDMTVADRDLNAGDVALRIPEHLVITLARVFGDESEAEQLVAGKHSELACLALYLMYEKKQGRNSYWYEFIAELDKQRGRGQMGARSPLIWDEGQAERLLAGSPVLQLIQERAKAVEKEYGELDTIWFMAASLFKDYPYDVPSETFTLPLFRQAFAAVQASTVHLQGVQKARRFALVPLGPPLLSYSSTSKAMLTWNEEEREVQLKADRTYKRGEPVYAWCGPQPNAALLLNYGIVDENNPYDKLSMTVTIPHQDPLFQQKRTMLQSHGLATMQKFELQRHKGLPPMLLPYLRLSYTSDPQLLQRPGFFNAGPSSEYSEKLALAQLTDYLQQRLSRYCTSVAEDNAVVNDPDAGPREKVAARLLRIEKTILNDVLTEVTHLPGAPEHLLASRRNGALLAGLSDWIHQQEVRLS
ncbi:hypothetical protein WJX74_005523 [Apatococcus lobatus]|uniref:Rubisco LSMT substrate-binding domain-containing protein n=1 Tax=Apatococcus lobatus TaxID=904363 RepID=A0AAW1RLG4_9CHLO